jgi:hypothetical protein
MRMRTHHRIAALAALAAAAMLGACGDTATRVQVFPVTVQVEYPATYAQTHATGATVVLRSTDRGTADTLTTGADGRAVFQGVIPGRYEISATRALTEGEAWELAGAREAVQLNALIPAEALSEATAGTPLTLRLAGSPLGSWVIKEVYYTGSRTPTGGTYFFDQFYEIYNNSTDTLYAGGLMIANIHGVSGQINPSSTPTPFQGDTDHVYADAVWRIPGGATDHPVPPGGSVVIAQQGIDHRTDPNANPASPVDLGNADWEMFVDVPDTRDLDSPTVPNMEMLHRRGGFYALVTVFGPGIVLARGDFESWEQVRAPDASPTSAPHVKIPVTAVIDAFEALQNAESGAFKRIPAALDAGFVFADGTYTSQSARRKTERTIAGRRVLRDTNNSSQDFEIVAPNPRGF